MRLGAIPEELVERVGLLLGRVPTPIGEAAKAIPLAEVESFRTLPDLRLLVARAA